MHRYKELKVWEKAVGLATNVYALALELPETEKYGLRLQIQRCSVSIASNIAEGAGRNSDKEFRYFLSIASGSCYELETQLIIAENVGMIKLDEEILNRITEIVKMIYVLSKSLDVKV